MNANKKVKSVLAALLAGMMVFASACNQGTTNSSEPAGDSSAAGESGQQESSEGDFRKEPHSLLGYGLGRPGHLCSRYGRSALCR